MGMTAATEESQAIANERRQLLELARKLIRIELPKIGSLRLPEHTIMAFPDDTRHVFARLNWTPQIVHAECLRLTVVSGLLEKAATATERLATVKRAEKTAADVAQQLPMIDEKIAKLESQKADLVRVNSEAESAMIKQANAVKRLRECCPPEIQEQYRSQMFAIKLRKLGGERVSDSEIDAVEKLLDYYVS